MRRVKFLEGKMVKKISFALLLLISLLAWLFSASELLKAKLKSESIYIYDSESGTFLGCLNCSEFSFYSVKNPYGPYGSEYSELSILNPYGEYGSEYSLKSPWNPYSLTPPVLVDSLEQVIGYLSTNPVLSFVSIDPKKLLKRRENSFSKLFSFPEFDDDFDPDLELFEKEWE